MLLEEKLQLRANREYYFEKKEVEKKKKKNLQANRDSQNYENC